MPYIKPEDRNRVVVGDTRIRTAGELNYVITNIIMEYLTQNGMSYDKINDIIGALEGAKLEFYRRVVVPYENVKISENGDVYVSQEPSKKV